MRVTAAGSLPGTDFRGALKFVLEELPELAPFPELPARGVGSQMIGRAAALLVDLPVALDNFGWVASDHADQASRRARATWRSDLDDFEELASDFKGTVKLAVCGPLTLASQLQRPRAEVMLADPGARRAVAESLAQGLTELLADLRRRTPSATFRVQIDEPCLSAIMGAQLRTASGLSKLPPIEEDEIIELLRLVSGNAILHSCAGDDWFGLASQAGFGAVYFDLAKLGPDASDQVAALVHEGREAVVGVLQSSEVDQVPRPEYLAERLLRVINEMGLDPAATSRLVAAPACGLAGWRRDAAGTAMRALVRAQEQVENELGT